MRISDWSSDVFSSDLFHRAPQPTADHIAFAIVMDGQTLKIIHSLLREQALLGVFRHADRAAEPARDNRRALVMARMMMGQEHIVDAVPIDQAATPVHQLSIGRRLLAQDSMRIGATHPKPR